MTAVKCKQGTLTELKTIKHFTNRPNGTKSIYLIFLQGKCQKFLRILAPRGMDHK